MEDVEDTGKNDRLLLGSAQGAYATLAQSLRGVDAWPVLIRGIFNSNTNCPTA